MIEIISKSNWDADCSQTYDYLIQVDLRDCEDTQQIIQKIGSSIKGNASQYISGNSLDALVDVMSDWFIENWGDEKWICITGGNRAFDFGREFALNLVGCFCDAFSGAIYDRSINHGGEGIAEEIGNLTIHFVLN